MPATLHLAVSSSIKESYLSVAIVKEIINQVFRTAVVLHSYSK